MRVEVLNLSVNTTSSLHHHFDRVPSLSLAFYPSWKDNTGKTIAHWLFWSYCSIITSFNGEIFNCILHNRCQVNKPRHKKNKGCMLHNQSKVGMCLILAKMAYIEDFTDQHSVTVFFSQMSLSLLSRAQRRAGGGNLSQGVRRNDIAQYRSSIPSSAALTKTKIPSKSSLSYRKGSQRH